MAEFEITVDEPFRYGSEQLYSISSDAFETGEVVLHVSQDQEPELEIELYVLVRNIPALIAALTRAREIAEGWAAEAQATRVLAIRNSLVKAGITPFAVEYDDENDHYKVQPMMPFSSEAFEVWADFAGYRIVDMFCTAVGCTYTLTMKDGTS